MTGASRLASLRTRRDGKIGGHELYFAALHRPERLTRNALALIGNAVVTSLLGLVFWVVAARLYPRTLLGEDSGLIAAMMLIAGLSDLSLGQGIPRLLPQMPSGRRRAVVAAYLTTSTLAVLLAVSFVFLAPGISSGFVFLGREHALQAMLVGAVALWTIFNLQDAVLTALRWTWLVPVENAVFAILKIVFLILFAGQTTIHHEVLVAWLAPLVAVLLPVNLLLFAQALKPTGRELMQTGGLLPLNDRHRVARYLALDYGASVLSQGSTMLLPVLVLAALGGAASAYFYVAFTIASATFMLAFALSTSLIVEGAHDESALGWLTRRALWRYITLVLPSVVILVAVAPLLLLPFGTDYAKNGTVLLRLLLAGCIPQALVTIYLGVERVCGRSGRILAVQGFALCLLLAGSAFVIPRYGLPGLGLAWLLTWSLIAMVVMPILLRIIRS